MTELGTVEKTSICGFSTIATVSLDRFSKFYLSRVREPKGLFSLPIFVLELDKNDNWSSRYRKPAPEGQTDGIGS